MAIYEKTSRGIEYNTDGNDAANVLKDMKHLAETSDNAIENAVKEATYDDKTIKARIASNEEDIENIKSEQSIQNTKIQANENSLQTLQETVTAQGQTISQHTTTMASITHDIEGLDSNKVDKVAGKGLSTEDFTLEEKQKLASLENYDDTEVKADISELQESQTTQDSEIETLQQENEQLKQDVEDLRNNSLTVEGTGTDITLQNTAKARLLKNELSGRKEQKQLEGKNLFNKSDKDIANGWINESGYPSGSTEYNQKTSGFIPIVAGEEYTQNYYNSNNYRAFYDEDKKFIEGSRSALTSGTYTVPQNAKYLRTNYFASQTDTFQVEQGSTATDYEEYCGGIPIPNPDHESPIKNVTGNANVKIQNKNLAWTGWEEDFVNRVNYPEACNIVQNRLGRRKTLYYTPDMGYGDYNRKYIFKIDWKENTQYTFSFDFRKRLSTDKTFVIEYTDGSITSIPNITNLDQWQHIVLVSSANKTIKYVRAYYTSGVSYIDLDTFMVLEGAYTEETIPSYVPHQEQNLPFTFESGQFLADDENLKDNGMNKKWKQVTFSGTSITLEDAKTNGAYFCNKKVSGNLVEKTLTFDGGVTDAIIQYELETEEIIPYNETQQYQYNNIQKARSYDDLTYFSSESDELGFNMNVVAVANANKVINTQNNEIDTIKSRLDLLEG